MDTRPLKTIPDDILAAMQQAAERAMSGIRDREEMQLACERMDRTREQIFARHGLMDFAVPAIRELRDEGE